MPDYLERVYSLAQEQNDGALMIGAYRTLACTLYRLGDFETAKQCASRGFQIWRSGGFQASVEEVSTPAVSCLYFEALCKWHFGEIPSCHETMAQAISLAKKLNDENALALALHWATVLAMYERNPAEVDRLTSDLIELSSRHNLAHWLHVANVYRGWARSASGDTAEGIPWIERGIRDLRASGSILGMPFFLALKAEALYLADRTREALEAIEEAEALGERFEDRHRFAEEHRLRGVFLATLGAEDAQIEASFQEAVRIAKEQKSVSLEKRAEATYAEYRRQKASSPGRGGFRLTL